MFKKFQQHNLIIKNQLRSKLLIKNFHNFNLFDSVQLHINLNKLKSLNDPLIFESFFLLEFISLIKSSITSYKKMYQQVNIQISTLLKNNLVLYFLLLLKIFYFPIIIRRNDTLKYSLDNLNNYWLSLQNVNIYPFLPDVFFKWNTPIVCFFNVKKSSYIKTFLLLKYWNLPLNKKN
jgi:hypothetical protein